MTGHADKNRIHRLVEEQYEKYPYPAAEESLSDFIASNSVQGGCPSHFFHLYWPFRKKDLDLDILVAGCGTMQAPKFAVNLPKARITAMDICEHSIEHTNRLLKQHNISNVTTRKLPIEEVGSLNQSFDLVISTGVLHHLPDPAEGLSALNTVLRNDGSMYLMLYGKYGRDGIYYMQDMLRRIGLDASSVSPQQLLAIRQLVSSMPPHHPLSAKKHFFGNFNVGDEELVDLFLHPQDRGYSIPDIARYLDECEMKLQSMLFRAHYAPRCCGIANSGFMDRINRLPDIEQLAIGELYRAATIMHFFVACKKERNEESYRIDLDSSDWKSLVPCRNPVLQQDIENTPPGYKAVIFSPMHQFRNIRYPIKETEMPLLLLPDDLKTLGEIQDLVKAASPTVSGDEYMRDFYRKMHDYDFLSFHGNT